MARTVVVPPTLTRVAVPIAEERWFPTRRSHQSHFWRTRGIQHCKEPTKRMRKTAGFHPLEVWATMATSAWWIKTMRPWQTMRRSWCAKATLRCSSQPRKILMSTEDFWQRIGELISSCGRTSSKARPFSNFKHSSSTCNSKISCYSRHSSRHSSTRQRTVQATPLLLLLSEATTYKVQQISM